MMKLEHFILIFVFSVLSLSIYGQEQSSIEMIKNQYRAYSDSIFKSASNPEPNLSSDWFINEGRRFIKITRNSPELDSINLAAHLSMFVGFITKNQKDSLIKIQKDFLKRIKDKPELIKKHTEVYTNGCSILSSFWVERGDYYRSYQVVFNAIQNIKKVELPKVHLNRLNFDLGYIMLDGEEDFDAAENTFRKILSSSNITKRMKNDVNAAMGDVFLYKNLDSASYYYNKAATSYKKYFYKGVFHNNNVSIAELLIKQGEFKKANSILEKSLKHQLKDSFATKYLGKTYLLLAKTADLNENRDDKYNYLKKAEINLERDGIQKRLEELYKDFSSFYKSEKKYDIAFKYDIKAKIVRDSIFSLKKAIAFAKVEAEYEIEKKEAKITKQLELISKEKEKKNMMMFGLIGLFVFLGISTYFYKQKLNVQKDLLISQDILNNEKINNLLEGHKFQSVKAHIDGQNKERERVSRDLHDSISGNLAAIKLKLSKLTYQTKEIDNIINSIDSTYKEVRTISRDLIPKKITFNSFTDLLEQLITSRKVEKLQVQAEFFPKAELNNISEKIQIEIYRIIQELTTNVNKHSKATKAFISITHHEKYINILVEDNGAGFDIATTKKGMGINNINSRVIQLNGTVDIESARRKGTTVNINIPL